MKYMVTLLIGINLLIATALTNQVRAQSVIPGTWATKASNYKANIGQQYTFNFPPGGTISSSLWGTDIYTHDCSIASAAVHAGLISTRSGGTVTIFILPGQASYKGSLRNGVTSGNWGSYDGSFSFMKSKTKVATPATPTAISGTWETKASNYKGRIGQRYTFYFPPGGTISSSLWGTDTYTHDCSIASAAVHAGLINTRNGGTVTIEIRSGRSSYTGSTRNGVKSGNWGKFDGSFIFVRD